MSEYTLHLGDCLEYMRTLPAESVQCCVTSPPYFGLRDYGHEGQIGLEPTVDAYVAKLVAVFAEVRRVLREDGTLWLNLGDSYASSQSNNGGYSAKSTLAGFTSPNTKGRRANGAGRRVKLQHGLKPKDLIGIPWRVAFALQADGWWLRSDIIWHKPNPMPESVTDRPTKAHEYIFLLSKSAKYFYDADAIKEPSKYPDDNRKARGEVDQKRMPTDKISGVRPGSATYAMSNKRSVWTVSTRPFADAHFAVFPEALIVPCIRAGSAYGDTVLDPFAGSGTTGVVAAKEGRSFIGCELNPDYHAMAEKRIADAAAQPLLLET